MEKLLPLLAFPLVWPFIAKRIWPREINATEMVINIVLICLLSVGIWEAGMYNQTADTEVWNGYVTGKDRKHGHYVTSYSCNCHETCSGSGKERTCSQSCDTCYEDHYTVTWTADTTAGDVTFDKKDSTSTWVYRSPDPEVYVRCKIGEPASIEHHYINYVRAVPTSLFHTRAIGPYSEKVPAYPHVHDFYRIGRVLVVDSTISVDVVEKVNTGLNEALKELGQKKQVNVVVILTGISDPSYRYAVENAWIGGKKNDVVVFVGLQDSTIIWDDVMTWALNKGNELFHVKMRDAVRDLKVLDPQTFVPTVTGLIEKHYDRPEMKQFEYLASEVMPPTWVIVLAIAIAIGGSVGLSLVFLRYEVEDYIGGFFDRSNRRWK